MGYFNKGTGAYSYPTHGASAGKPPVAPASNQYVTCTGREKRERVSERERERERERGGRGGERRQSRSRLTCLLACLVHLLFLLVSSPFP
jgi:hypothetical protein